MAFKNFKLETDADGIALVTWDIPGRSMNVLDETTITELAEIVKQTSSDAAVKGVVVTSGKEAFSGGADLSMLEGMNRRYSDLFKAKGEVAANQMLFDESRKSSLLFRAIETSGKPWAAAISGLADDEAGATITTLLEHSTRDDNVYRHAWRPGDVVVWDNGAVLHKADHSGVVGDRVMHRGMVATYPGLPRSDTA